MIVSNTMYSQHNNQYSQYMFNGLSINPAYAGANEALNLTLLHRNQWTGFDGAPKTTSISAHTPLPNKKLNIGLSYTSDIYGVTNKNIANAIFAYKLKFKKSTLSLGILGGVDITRNDWDKIVTTTSGDALFEGQSQKLVTPLAGAGAFYLSKNYFIGLSAPALIQFSTYTKNTYNPILLNSGCILKYSEEMVFKPSILVKYINNSPIEFDLNLNAYYKNFGLGFSYRTNDAVVFLMNYSINDQFKVGYSYDLTITKLKTYNRGSHEVMLKYEFGYKLNAASPRYF